jgi:hypothetical protein
MVQTTAPAPGPAVAESPPPRHHSRWWLWTLLGVVAAGTVAAVVIGTSGKSDPACPTGRTCQ